MPLNLEDKKVLVAEVAEVAKTALSVVAAENRGLTVSQMTDLRAKARAQGVYMRVVKNTLARKAFAGTAFEPVGPKLKGPLLLAFSKDDPGAAARVVKAFAKDNEKLVATLVSLGGEVADEGSGPGATARSAHVARPAAGRGHRRAGHGSGTRHRCLCGQTQG
jgi:large subunit ribosomal protein L10